MLPAGARDRTRTGKKGPHCLGANSTDVRLLSQHPFASNRVVTRLQEDFLRILPSVQQHAHCYFRHLGAEAREEAVAQATALAFATFRRLQERGKDPAAFSGKLARLAAKQVQAGRSL